MFQPFIAQRTAMTLQAGRLNTQLDIKKAADGTLTVKGDVDVTGLKSVDELQQSFIKWKDLQVAGIQYNSQPASLQIASITAREPYARVIIAPDRTVNVQVVLAGPSKGGASLATQLGAANARAGGVTVAGVKGGPPGQGDAKAIAANAQAEAKDAKAAASATQAATADAKAGVGSAAASTTAAAADANAGAKDAKAAASATQAAAADANAKGATTAASAPAAAADAKAGAASAAASATAAAADANAKVADAAASASNATANAKAAGETRGAHRGAQGALEIGRCGRVRRSGVSVGPIECTRHADGDRHGARHRRLGELRRLLDPTQLRGRDPGIERDYRRACPPIRSRARK